VTGTARRHALDPSAKKNRVTGRYLARLVARMIPGNKTIRELADAVGLSYETVRQMCNLLHEEDAAHIAMWRDDPMGRQVLACFKLGEGVDAKPRSALETRERWERYHRTQEAKAQERSIHGQHTQRRAAQDRATARAIAEQAGDPFKRRQEK
jgi:hypothetical protein